MFKWKKKERSHYLLYIADKIVAEVVNTSQTGTDHYPWDWYFTTIGDRYISKGMKHSGVADSLKSAKSHIEYSIEHK